MAINVLVFEDNDLLRDSLASLIHLQEKFELVAARPNVLKVDDDVRTFSPDIILMDIDMPGMTGIDAVRKIRRTNSVPIIMLTVFDDNKHVFDAIRAGATGYLLKKDISKRLFTAIEEVLDGGAPMSPSIARMVIASMHQTSRDNVYQLTPREKEILSLLSKGESYKRIADQLVISIDTVRTHIKKIYEKLHVHSQTEAVSKAIHEGLV